MKQLIQKIIVGSLVSLPMISNAQFNIWAFPINTCGRTNPTMQKIGIGNFPTNASVQAKLQVNQFLLAPNLATNGFLFRTDGSNTVANSWQLFTGATTGSVTEKFRLFVPANSNDVRMFGFQNGAMKFGTNGVQRIHINENTGTTNGFVGIGNGFSTPVARLHLNEPTPIAIYTQWTNSFTGVGATDGLRIGVNNLGEAQFIQQTDAPMVFYAEGAPFTSPLERMRITHDTGPFFPNTTRVSISYANGVGAAPIINPQAMLHLGLNTSLSGGWRNWMDVGTFMGSPPPITQDYMYVGLKEEAWGNDAMITWGDGICLAQQTPGANTHYMRIAYTTPAGCGDLASSSNGLEIQRITPTGFTGIGGDPVAGNNYTAFGGLEPGNTLEVNSPQTTLGPTFSGLRFTDVNNTVTPMANPSNGVLSLSAAGDVIWVDAGTLSGGIGNYCGTPQVPLTGNFEVNLDAYNYYFTENRTATTNVAIGFPCATPNLMGKLSVYQPALNFLFTPSLGLSTAGYFVDDAPSTAIYGIGVWGQSVGSAFANIGGRFEATNATTANIGVWGIATGSGNFAGYFDGDVQVNGNISATGTITPSDQQFKKNIQSLTNATSVLLQLVAKTFYYDSTNFIGFNFDTKNHMGLIAQEVNSVLPNLISESVLPAEFDSLGNQIRAAVNYKSLNYQELIPLLIAGFNEQQSLITNKDSVINDLQNQIDDIKACLLNNNICNEGNRTSNNENGEKQVVKLKNLNAIILDQNLPNPFAESTQINYVIPDDVLNAKLLFYDMSGRIINEVNINKRGNGTLTVYGENLEKGIYTYSLIADGKLIATKKMVKK